MDPFYTTQLKWIEELHQIRGPFIDGFFKFFNFFDRPEFFLILIPVVWLGFSWKGGLRLFYIMALSAFINYGLKQLFETPRPFYICPDLAVIKVSGYGFPSGGGQTAVLLSGILWNRFKNGWSLLIAANFFFWVSLSRVYLGVHFPTDVLGGWVVGAFLLFLFIVVFPRVERCFQSLNRIQLLLISQILPLVLICFLLKTPQAQLGFMTMGVGFGVFICSCYDLFLKPPSNAKERLLRSALGVLGVFTIYKALSFAGFAKTSWCFDALFFIIGIWLSLGASLVWLGLKKRFRL